MAAPVAPVPEAPKTHPADSAPERPRSTSPGGSKVSRRSSVIKSKGDRRRTVFVPKARELKQGKWGFFSEMLRFRSTILRKVVPQLVLAALIGVLCNFMKVSWCGEDVMTDADCPLCFDPAAHSVVGVMFGVLLVFRTNLAYDRYDEAKTALGEIYCGIRNLNVSFVAFLRVSNEDEENYRADSDMLAAKLSRDRVELLRLTNLLYAMIRQAIREQRHGYSDTGPVSDQELITKDRAGKPRIPDLVKDQSEIAELEKVDPFNRANILMARIVAIIEHHRRLGHLSERASLDVFHDAELVMAAFKVCERIVTTPIPYSYQHMINFLLFFFVYSVPFVFTAYFDYTTSFPSVVVALTYYGVSEISRCMEDPFTWEEPCHDLTGEGWRIYRENTQLHEKVDRMEKEETDARGGKPATVAEKFKMAFKMAPALKAAIDAKSEEEEELSGISDYLESGVTVTVSAEDDVDAEDIVDRPMEIEHSWHSFFTSIFRWNDTVLPKLVPQLVVSILVGIFAQVCKLYAPGCGPDIREASECWITFTDDAHNVVGVALGFMLVFRVDLAYERYYDAKGTLGAIYNGIRNLNVAFAVYIRESKPDEIGYSAKRSAELKNEVAEDRSELLRMTNLMYTFMRQALREYRLGYPGEGLPSDEEVLQFDRMGRFTSGDKPYPLFKEGEYEKVKSIGTYNRPNWVAARMQAIVEHHRRTGVISERASFEIYHQLEEVLSAFKNCERVISTPIPYTYLHMVQYILFFFVYSAPFVFSANFQYITPFPSAVVSIGFYGIAEMGRAMQDPFKWEQPCHDLSTLGLRMYKENLVIHEKVSAMDESTKGSRMMLVMQQALAAAEAENSKPKTDRRKSTSALGESVSKERSGQELEASTWAFITVIFKYKNTVISKVMPQMVLAGVLGMVAFGAMLWQCGPDVTEDMYCDIAFSSNAHQVAGGIISFLLVFRTTIAYYRYYEGKKYLGMMYSSIRNLNVGFCSFLRPDHEGEKGYDPNRFEAAQKELSKDHIELRRLGNVLYAFIRQAIREQRHGYPDTAPTDKELINDDQYGHPSLSVMLDKNEKEVLSKVDFYNRPNVIVTRMQAIIEHHRRLGNISERGAFDLYHDLEMCLDAFKQSERVISTKMPYQYMHMVYFMLFIFVFSAPFIFSVHFRYISWLPSMITAMAFYGIAEIGRSIEDPFSWEEPKHDLTGTGWRIFSENLQLHEVCTSDAKRGDVQGPVDKLLLGTDTDTKAQITRKQSTLNVVSSDKKALKHKAPTELSKKPWGFFTEVFMYRETIHQRIVLQVLFAIIVGMIAQLMKVFSCGPDIIINSQCWCTFTPYAHFNLGVVLGLMLVFRTNLAYDRYYEAKTAIGQMHNAIRNLNIGICCFIRCPQPGFEGTAAKNYEDRTPDEPGYSDTPQMRALALELLKQRTELLRLTGVVFGLIRHILREQRIGYPTDTEPGDRQLLMQDDYGKPSLGSLLSKEEVDEYTNVSCNNRPNLLVTRIQATIEHHRRLGHISERGAFDLYHECELMLDALKSCERVVTTPIPYQYLHMVNFATFFFVYTAPFVFTVSFQWIAWFPSAIVAMGFYGVTKIGEVIEKPFDWEEPNHDLTGVGWRLWRESIQIHKAMANMEPMVEDAKSVIESLEAKADKRPDVEGIVSAAMGGDERAQAVMSRRRASVVEERARMNAMEFPRTNVAFITEIFKYKNTVLHRIVPQIVAAALMGCVAQGAKIAYCGLDVETENECDVTFASTAHALSVAVLGISLVFCNILTYNKYYEGKVAFGQIYDSLRNVNIAAAAFMREALPGEPNHGSEKSRKHQVRLRQDCVEIRRLTNILFAFMRQAVREQRHGYPDKLISPEARDEELLKNDECGTPSLKKLLTEKEREYYLSIDFNNRPNIVVAQIQRLVERNRRMGFIYEKSAFDIYHESETALLSLKTCEKIVTMPIPYPYLHMLNFVNFCFVYTAPFVFSASFKWVTPLPSAVLAIGFYGIAEIGRVVADPFNWIDPKHDISAIGARIEQECERIFQGKRRYSIAAGAQAVPDGLEVSTA